jgi:hypothetical protein
MKKYFMLLFFTVCLFTLASAQKIKYASSFENAKQLALQRNKPVAVLLTIEPPVNATDFYKALKDEAVIEKLNNNFINFTIDRRDTASAEIIRNFKIYRFPSFIFIDAKGGLMFSDVAPMSNKEMILKILDKAITATGQKSLVEYDSLYKAGNHERFFLKEYILRRQAAGIYSNADIIETYVAGLSVSDLKNYQEILFILKAGPLVDSSAYKLVQINKLIVDSVYKTEKLSDRIAFNNNIISNTMESAIKNKNYQRASAAAMFTRVTLMPDHQEGEKRYMTKLMEYYRAVKDTSMYLRYASNFYDRYYMLISADSIKKRDSLKYEKAKRNASVTAIVSSDSSVRKTFSFAFAKNTDATALNNAAWTFYELAGNNQDYLLKALLWSKRSIELNPVAGFYDTYAHLLYRLKFFDEAESMQKKAVEIAKKENKETKIYQDGYEKMKKKIL